MRPDSDKHVIVPKLVKDRLIRIETKQTRFHHEILDRLDKLEKNRDATHANDTTSTSCTSPSGV